MAQKIKANSTIQILSSQNPDITVGGFYIIQMVQKQFCIFDNQGHQVVTDQGDFTWQITDNVVMWVRIVTSKVPDIAEGTVCRVFYDRKHDERYIFDANREKVLFDKMLFKYEVL